MPNRYTFHRGAHMPSVESAQLSFVAPTPPRYNRLLALRHLALGFPEWAMEIATRTDRDMPTISFSDAIERNRWIRVTRVNAVIVLSSISQLYTAELGSLGAVLQFILLGCSTIMVYHGQRVCAQFSNHSRPRMLVNPQTHWRLSACLFALQTTCHCATLLGLISSNVHF